MRGFIFIFVPKTLPFPVFTVLVSNTARFAHHSRKTQMLSQERTFFARKAAQPVTAVFSDEWTIWSKLQILVLCGFLAGFALNYDVSCVCISAGIILMVLNAWKRRDFDERPVLLDEAGVPIPPKKTYDMDGNEIIEEVRNCEDEAPRGAKRRADISLSLFVIVSTLY